MLVMLIFNHVVVGAQYLNRYLMCALELWVVIELNTEELFLFAKFLDHQIH